MPDEFSIIDRQRPTVRLARQSGWLLICLLATVTALRFFLNPVTRLDHPPVTFFGSLPILSLMWHVLYMAFAGLVSVGIARGQRKMETIGHVCLVTALGMQSVAVILFGLRTGTITTTLIINAGAGIASYLRIWAIRQPARAEITGREEK